MKMPKHAEASSVFVVGTHFEGSCFGTLFEVKLDGQGKEGSATHETQPVLETVSRFTTKDLGQGMWKFCTLGAELYILPDGGPDLFDMEVCFPKCSGHIFDIKTGKVVSPPLKPPAPKWFGTHVSAYGKIYSLSDPYCSCDVPESSFERYDPTTQSWQKLCSFPYSEEYGNTEIQGYAVCDKILLFSMCGYKGNYDALWAYDVIKNKWCQVHVENTDCYFQSRAVVVNKTIYALSTSHMVVAFSITSNQNEKGDISYSIGSSLQLKFPQDHIKYWRSDQHLVHLGDLVFYLVQSGFDDEVDVRQPLSITKFKIVGGSEINIISSMLFEVDLGDSGPFCVQLCFRPEWEDVTLMEKEIPTSINLAKQVSVLHQGIPVPNQAGITPLPAYEVCSSSQPPEPSEVAEQFQQVSIQQEEAPSQSIQQLSVSSKSMMFPLRPGKGTTDKRFLVEAPCFPEMRRMFAELSNLSLRQYDSMLPMATSRKADEAFFSSDSSSSNNWIYEVFLSFRGVDTRNTFTGHLYLALKEAGINAFIDDNELKRGEIIDEELVRAIQGSKISVIVFSRRYADSCWCLEELVKIMECRTTRGQLVFPVFYDVDPSDVWKQSGSFAEAFDQKHGDKDEKKVRRWRTALIEAANLSGWDLRTKADGHEGNFIQMITQEITKYLNKIDLNVADNEVGIDARVRDIISHLDVGILHDVRVVGICGMGGIGKTTLAKALYNKFRQDFEASSFLANVRETMQNNGMVSLQESLLSDISKTSMTEVGHDDRGINVIKNILGCRRVFVVIDDVDQVEQSKALAIDRDSFGLGSRVLITTRDGHLLKQLGVDAIYQVPLMDEEESIKLFSLHAFKTHCPPNEEYLKLSRRVVDCCGGLPLALKVLGSFLVQRSTKFWKSAIEKLQTIPPLEVHEKLKISFDGLNDDTERDIFLDISCFHIGKQMDYVKQILDSCDLFPDSGIEVLIQRCLVTVNKENQLMMHDLLRDMGREIVCAKCRDNPGKWSRVWRWEDAVEVLRDESGSDEIQGLTLDLWGLELGEKAEFSTEAFSKMKRLRFLELHDVKLIGGCKYLPNKLRWLEWTGFPLEFIPKEFSLGEAVAIYLRGSNLKHVWEDSGVLAKLKSLDLSYSSSLKQSPDFSTIPNLEELVLESCEQLSEVHQSIGGLKRLSLVNLTDCKILKELPRSFYKLKSVVTLVLDGCEGFKKLDEEIGDMTSLSTLHADCTAITELPSSIVRLKKLRCLSLVDSVDEFDELIFGNSCDITNVPEDLGSPSSLKRLDIRSRNLQNLPSLRGLYQLEDLCLVDCNLTDELIEVMDLGSLSSLKSLDLSCNRFSSLPNSFSSLPSLRSLSKLVDLDLRRCTNLVAIADLPTSLTKLCASDCNALEIMPDFSDMSNMREMYLDGCAELVEVVGLDESLKSSMRLLDMVGCTDLTATFKEKILQGWNFIGPADIRYYNGMHVECMFEGPGGIFLPPSDIPEWFQWVFEGGRMNFYVPEIRGSNVIAITLCFTGLEEDNFYVDDPSIGILVTNHTKLTTFFINPVESGPESGHNYVRFLWLGHLPSNKFNLEGGDFVEVLLESEFEVQKSGASLVWDTKQPEFRVDTDRVDGLWFSCPYTGGNNNMA